MDPGGKEAIRGLKGGRGGGAEQREEGAGGTLMVLPCQTSDTAV